MAPVMIVSFMSFFASFSASSSLFSPMTFPSRMPPALAMPFIFGLFGAPKLGAMGVAIATSASRMIELAACFAVSHFSRDIKLDFRYLFSKNRLLAHDIVGVDQQHVFQIVHGVFCESGIF